MTTRLRALSLVLVATISTGWLLDFQGAAQSQPQPPRAAGEPGTAQAGGRGGFVQDLTGADFSPKPPIAARSAREQAGTFLLPAGYRMELVASDPDINNPAVIEWDGNGRMYVSEFRSYMRDADATGEHEPTSRISRWESTKGDGVYDRHTVFVDHVLFPRMILPIDKNCILTNETHSDDVVKYCDSNDDGVADKRDVFYTGVGVGRDGNVEHEQSGFIWGLDNWIYSTYNSFRFRWTPDGIQREPTAPNGASWGLTEDNDGKMWFINAGAERGPVNFQFPIQYGALTLDDGFEPGFDTVWPAPSIGDMQGGMRRIRQPLGALNHFTATAGAQIVRTDRYPQDMHGDLLFAEPVGRLIRRAQIVKTDGLTQLRNVYPGSEFVLGTDPLFRPVNLKQGPDGAIYIADMYHGIIQEAQWTPRGSYLRAKIEQYQLDKITEYGRIWRLRFDGTAAVPAIGNTPAQPAVPAIQLDSTQPRMLDETASQLVRHLEHPNGWWRDTAQRLLVLKQDRSVVPALQKLATTGSSIEARFHALWTLEGLRALDAALVREQMKDANPRMRVQAIRASETLYKAGDKSFAAEYRALTKDADVDVVIQAMLTLNLLKVSDASATIQSTMAANKTRGVQEIGKFLMTPAPATSTAGRALSSEEQQTIDRGATIYSQLCFTCHAEDGRGAPMGGGPAGALLAPSIAGSPRVPGAPRLRDQDAAARPDRTDRGHDLPASHDSNGNAERPVGCGYRLLRPERLWQYRDVHPAIRRRARPCRVEESNDAVDRGRDRERPAGADAVARWLEDDREPQPGERRARTDACRVDVRRTAAGGHVVPGRAAGSRAGHGSAVRCRRRRQARRGRGQSRTWRGVSPASTAHWVRAAVSRRGLRRRHDVAASGRGFGCVP